MLAAAVGALALVAALVTWVVLDDDPYSAPPPSGRAAVTSPAAAAAALHALEAAVRSHDPAAARGLAPSGDDRAGQHLAGVVTNARALRVRDFSLRYIDADGTVDADGSWTAAADASWRFAGFDHAVVHTEVTVHLRDTAPAAGEAGSDTAALTAIGGGGRRSPLWLAGPVQVRRADQTLVLVDGGPARADRYARLARTAVEVVHRVLPRWRSGLVVEVPGSGSAVDRTLDADPGQYANIAAVTATVDGSGDAHAPVHVFVNPAVFDRLRARGAQVVMSHEVTHVATDAATSDMPLWLLEGFADYVALRDVPLPLTTTASQIRRQVERQGPPAHLPGSAEFDTTTTHLGATYESAWFACRLLAQDGGEDALVRLYHDVQGGTPLARALRADLGLTVAGLTRQWRTELVGLTNGQAAGPTAGPTGQGAGRPLSHSGA